MTEKYLNKNNNNNNVFLVKKTNKKTWFKKIVFFFHSDCNVLLNIWETEEGCVYTVLIA